MSRQLRVAMIIQTYYPHVGGAETQLAALASRLQEQGVDIHILTRRYANLKAFEWVDGVPVHRLPATGAKAFASFLFTCAGLYRLRRLQPHVIHAHELLSPTTTAIAAKRLFNIPVVAKVLRGGGLGDVTKLKTRKSGQRRIAMMKRSVDAFITISKEIDRELEELGIEETRRVFIPNGVDLERYRPVSNLEKQRIRTSLGVSGNLVAAFAGRFVLEKRVIDLVQIWPEVRRNHPGAELYLLGDGPEKQALQRCAGAGVHFPGQVSDVRPYLQAADVFILPSTTEGLSNSLLEAMAMGLPSVATPVGGALDLIEDRQNGWLTPPEDPASLLRAVTDLFAMDADRIKIGEEARKKVAQDYGLDRTSQRLFELYNNLSR